MRPSEAAGLAHHGGCPEAVGQRGAWRRVAPQWGGAPRWGCDDVTGRGRATAVWGCGTCAPWWCGSQGSGAATWQGVGPARRGGAVSQGGGGA